MTITKNEMNQKFPAALVMMGRSPEIPESEDVYGWLIGSWQLDVFDYHPDGTERKSSGEVHFAWVLEGRAIQDTFIIPQRSERRLGLSKAGNRYGTTLRVWDPSIQAWRVTWSNPVNGTRDELIGRRIASDIIQIGRHADGTPIRWNFREVTTDSFRWTGEALQPDGNTWKLETELRAKRI